MCKQGTVPEALVANVTAPLNALIILKPEEECQTCHSTSTDRRKYACPNPKCNHRFCGHCAVIEPLAARMAQCPKCKQRFPWPK